MKHQNFICHMLKFQKKFGKLKEVQKQKNESLQKIQPQLFGPDIASILMLC